jgi:hypothetical protein
MTFSNPDFNARIARISSGAGSSKSTLYVGLDEIYQVSYPGRGKSAAPTAASSGVLYPMALLFSTCLGILSFMAAAWVRLQTMGLDSALSDLRYEMALQFGSGLAVGLGVGLVCGLRSRQMIVVMALGVLVAMTLSHNVVHLYPELFSQAFSPAWVDQVRSATAPNSALWMGQSYRF